MKKDNSKVYIVILLVFLLAVVFTVVFILFIYPENYDTQCRTRENQELESHIDLSVLSANVCVVKYDITPNGNTATLSYSLGASGVIFKKEQNKYYALTACHVIADADQNTSFLIQPYDTLPYSKSGQDGNYQSLEEYYSQFPVAKVEYYDESCDLAVLSFYSPKDLGILEIAETNASKDTEIAIISNPEGKKFIRTYGSILSDTPIVFSADDDHSSNLAIKHNAYVAPGSSGSGVLSYMGGKFKIVGINIGGGTNFMDKFQYGVMIPCQQIRRFLDNWEVKTKL